ncbi:MAG: hypothetical protein H0T68_12345 [Gemmatimonadales bacterium]|nr:hypothetical protein [Gemmatimonadales bacterium]
MVVGAYALAAHGLPRATRDIDLWVGTAGQNPERVRRALIRFGAPVQDLSIEDLCRPDLIFQVGVAPHRIDVLTSIDGVDFARAWSSRLEAELGGLRVPVLSREHLIQNKRAAGRHQDIADLAWLEKDKGA